MGYLCVVVCVIVINDYHLWIVTEKYMCVCERERDIVCVLRIFS